MRSIPRHLALTLVLTVLAAACGSSSSETTSEPGVRVVSVDQAADTLADAPDDLVLLDVRTPEEFAEARIEGAVLIDFYEADFADRIAELDRDVPYVLYCRSGNRSAEARSLMDQLGFSDVQDIDGGIVSWSRAGQPVVSG